MVSVACLDDVSVAGVQAQLRRDVDESCRALRSLKMVGCFARVLIGGECAEVSGSCSLPARMLEAAMSKMWSILNNNKFYEVCVITGRTAYVLGTY